MGWFKNYKLAKILSTLDEVKMVVTQINGGKQHNTTSAEVDFVIDVHVNDVYSNEEITRIIKRESSCDAIESGSLLLKYRSISRTLPLL